MGSRIAFALAFVVGAVMLLEACVDIEDDRTLLIQFYGGVEECYGLDHVADRYGTDKVTVTLFEGRVPNAGVCIDMAVPKAVRVELREPLDGRKVVDGAAAGA